MRDRVAKFIEEHGGVLRRKKKHEVYQFPGGQVFVRANTPSDHRADANNLSDLRKILGITARKVKKVEQIERIDRPKTKPTPAPARAQMPASAPATPARTRPSIPLGTFATSFSRRIERTDDVIEKEGLQTELDRVLWEQAMSGVKKLR